MQLETRPDVCQGGDTGLSTERETISIPKCVVTRILRPVDSDNFSLLP